MVAPDELGRRQGAHPSRWADPSSLHAGPPAPASPFQQRPGLRGRLLFLPDMGLLLRHLHACLPPLLRGPAPDPRPAGHLGAAGPSHGPPAGAVDHAVRVHRGLGHVAQLHRPRPTRPAVDLLTRIIGVPLVLILLVCASTSQEYRAKVWAAMKASSVVSSLFVAFTAMEIISIPLSRAPFFSFDAFVNAQISWTTIFFASVYVFQKPGRTERMIRLLWIMAIVTGIIALLEARVRHPLWAGHIPSFLQINDPAVKLMMAGAGNGVYRTGRHLRERSGARGVHRLRAAVRRQLRDRALPVEPSPRRRHLHPVPAGGNRRERLTAWLRRLLPVHRPQRRRLVGEPVAAGSRKSGWADHGLGLSGRLRDRHRRLFLHRLHPGKGLGRRRRHWNSAAGIGALQRYRAHLQKMQLRADRRLRAQAGTGITTIFCGSLESARPGPASIRRERHRRVQLRLGFRTCNRDCD